ncbi:MULTISPECIES: hypothetical protein [unclassified Streptomyces]|uniref:hypothetical protein n=1 Tax=unclassified Streptomyces TaxID=2593676 RepID=UPI002E0D14DF|nr:MULTISPECIES: hypothetical protein [unclassified Streptomyces]WSR23379.1 hypothetical protein OG573_32490 [Streptomyces sp. NBC_01205]
MRQGSLASCEHHGLRSGARRRCCYVGQGSLEQLQEEGAGAAVWRRRGRTGEQLLTAALDNPDGDALYRDQAARADAQEERRRAAEREKQRPVCQRCG